MPRSSRTKAIFHVASDEKRISTTQLIQRSEIEHQLQTKRGILRDAEEGDKRAHVPLPFSKGVEGRKKCSAQLHNFMSTIYFQCITIHKVANIYF